MELVKEYMRFYYKYSIDAWYAMGPMEYGMVLSFILVCGWLLMKSGAR